MECHSTLYLAGLWANVSLEQKEKTVVYVIENGWTECVSTDCTLQEFQVRVQVTAGRAG